MGSESFRVFPAENNQQGWFLDGSKRKERKTISKNYSSKLMLKSGNARLVDCFCIDSCLIVGFKLYSYSSKKDHKCLDILRFSHIYHRNIFLYSICKVKSKESRCDSCVDANDGDYTRAFFVFDLLSSDLD